jgi:GT2 family glycosyltransferase
MNEYKKQVSIIIVNYNTKDLTKKSIQSVLDKTEGIEYEIIIVDNDSQDGSLEDLKKNFQNKITIIQSKKNLGFGRANNLGIKYATGKYIFLLNSDTELINNAIKIFYDYMEQNEQVGVCGGNLYDANYKPEHSYRLFKDNLFSYFLYNYLYLFHYYLIYKITKKKRNYLEFNYSNKVVDVGFITGADMFIRKNVLSKSGLFDENIFMYGEDSDLNFRIRNLGYSIKSIPQAKIFHYGSKSLKNVTKMYDIWLTGTYYFYFKHFKRKTCFIYFDMKLNLIRIAITSLLLFNINKAKLYFNMAAINKEKYLEQKKFFLRNEE